MSGAPELAAVDRIVERCGRGPESLIPILLAIQQEYRHLPVPALRRVSALTGVAPSVIAGVASFYPRFRAAPAGRHLVRVCVGTACHVKGSQETLEEFRHHLSIAPGSDTDRAGLFTVEEVACLGCCSLAPAVRIGDLTYGGVGAGRVPEVLDDFLEKTRTSTSAVGEEAAPPPGREPTAQARVCLCTGCLSAGAGDVYRELRAQGAALGLDIEIKTVSCTGFSSAAPLVEIILPGGGLVRHAAVRADQVRELLLSHLEPRGLARRARAAAVRLVERLYAGQEPRLRAEDHREAGQGDLTPHEGRQVRIATEGAGALSPLDIDEWLGRGGFAALTECLGALTPADVVNRVRRSGLRGRGGGGYPTGQKWEEVRAAPGSPKYVVCNGDEGDPGAFMDRMLLESFPFRVIEGMAIAAWAVGATEGVLYVRGEYAQAVERIGRAVGICRERGLLGASVLGSGWPLELRVVEGAGAFVCGEETALVAALEGRRSMPRPRPPYPSTEGFHSRTTLVNNVETLALVPAIVLRGPERFAAVGSAGSRGTKTFALAGKVARGGLVEVPLGITLREIVEEIGGGVPGGRALKAIQVGGPAGGCVPAGLADTPVDYEALREAGALMGSGGLVVLDEDDCMVELARYFMAFARRESCGRCTYCRVGTVRMLEILEDLCAGRGRAEHLGQLETLGDLLQKGSLCGLGRTAPNTALTTLRHFRSEYEAHLQGRCPARRCRALIRYRIGEGCIGCTRCAQRCSAGAIAARPYERHFVDDARCTRCDVCRQVCPVAAVRVD